MTVESLPILVLNPHSRCNCRCTMCDIWKTTGVQELTVADLERQLSAIEKLGVQWVVLTGGEPLMHSNLWDLCAPLRKRGIRITLLSSGLLLARHAGSLVEHIDDVIVSLDGPPQIHDAIRGIPRAFELLAAGVRQLRTLRSGIGIAARCTVQRSNFRHLVATVEAAHGLCLNSISFLAADLESSAFNRPESWSPGRQSIVGLCSREVCLLESEIEALIVQGECRAQGEYGEFIRESPAKLRRIAQHFRAHLEEAEPVAPVCNAPWVSAVIDADGAVRPCFFHRPIGHLNSGLPLDQILNGPQAVAFRANLDVPTNPICRKCVCSLHWTGQSSIEPALEVAVEQAR